MIVLGLLVLLAAGGLAVSGITIRDDGARSQARSGLLGYHLPGPGSRLFFFGLVLAAAAMSGLARMVAGLARGVRRLPASRQLPQAPTGLLPAAGAAAARRFGGTNRTLWSRTAWSHRDENRTGWDHTDRGRAGR